MPAKTLAEYRAGKTMNLEDLDMTPRYLPDEFLIADWSLRGKGAWKCPVIGSHFYPPDCPRPHPIMLSWGCIVAHTTKGDRAFGCYRAYINSELRMVVVGTPKRDEVRIKWAIVPEDKR